MYIATMVYEFKADCFADGVRAWEEEVFLEAKGREGLQRMELCTHEPKMFAIGHWRSPEDAQAFMATGVFARLTQRIEAMLTHRPEPDMWQDSLLFEAE